MEQSSGEVLGGYDSGVFNWRSGPNNAVAPNESDEAALEFLHKHGCDLSRAQFHVTTQLSGGSGERVSGNTLVFKRASVLLMCYDHHHLLNKISRPCPLAEHAAQERVVPALDRRCVCTLG